MINKDYLDKLIIKHQTIRQNIYREYYQHVFLSYCYQQKGADNLFFKGGTALRLLHGSPRFSEDLDFDANIHDQKVIENILEDTMVEMEREQIVTNLTEGKSTTGGYLAVVEFKAFKQRVPVKLEISFRKSGLVGETFVVENDFIPAYNLMSLTIEQLVEGKMKALFDRHKPRDFFDLYYILRAQLLPVSMRSKLKEVLPLLRKSNIDFRGELGTFLPKNQALIIKYFSDSLTREIERYRG